jgi:cytochrome d ubiquinol oxidase subunit I
MVARHQPAKLAAFEGHFQTGTGGTALYAWGWPDEKSQTVKGGVGVPGMLSFLVYRDFRRPVPGLDQLSADYGSPPVWLSFQTYHIMIGLGMLFIFSTALACWYWWRGTLFEKRWLLWFFVFAVALAFAANETGWIATEVGRQPWIVYPTQTAAGLIGGLRTSDAVSEAVGSEQVLGSLVMFGVLYALLFVLWVYLLDRTIRHGPDSLGTAASPAAESPLSAIAERATHLQAEGER